MGLSNSRISFKVCLKNIEQHMLNTEHEVSIRITKLTLQIQESYPELYRNLNEMYATLPIAETPVISVKTLNKWLESLNFLIAQYDVVHR